MKTIIFLSNRLITRVKLINKLKDIWLESRIKRYAKNVKKRYPSQLSIVEKVFAPLITNKITGTVANLITVIRILLAIIIFQLLIVAYPFTESGYALILSLMLFVIAAILDLLDGPAARALGEVSELGKILDPLADKILLASVLIPVGYMHLPSLTYWIIIGQESFLIAIAVIKYLAKLLPFTMASQANLAGKIKNVLELIAGSVLIISPFHINLIQISNLLFVFSIPLALGSIFGYLSSIRRIKN